MARQLYMMRNESWEIETDNAPEMVDEILYIESANNKFSLDMLVNCKYEQTAYRRFRKAVLKAAADGVFGKYDIVNDLFGITDEAYDADYNSPFLNYKGAMKDCGFIFGIEWIDENQAYLWLNVKPESRMEIVPIQSPEQIKSGIVIFKENKTTGLQCGINAYGELFVGDKESGANLPYTRQNKERILAEFERWNRESETEWDVFFDDRF